MCSTWQTKGGIRSTAAERTGKQKQSKQIGQGAQGRKEKAEQQIQQG